MAKHQLGSSIITLMQADPSRARERIYALYENSVVQDATAPNSAKWDAEARSQDGFFGIRRVYGNSAGILIAGLLLSFLEVLENVKSTGCAVPDQEFQELFQGAASILSYCKNGTAEAIEKVSLPVAKERVTNFDPKLRWEVGHRLFFSLTQGITAALSCFATAMADGQMLHAIEAMRLATALMEASRGALLFTSDFPKSSYSDDVRISMMPPYAAPGFSGVQGRDHQVLVGVLRGLRPVFGEINRDSYPYEEFKSATMRLHAAHEYVCAKFVGETRPSLLMEARGGNNSSRIGAASVVRQINERRLRLIDPSLPKG
ncbi:hypothetical protein [Streptomyces colonosanans]|uniref:hypothetical protein n=1 Tax=Streptomyces colonosanans TaxID=1428652 RepID=UPI00115F9879|nr:hypothetical protein [Streptomyces colonosanans]